MERFNSYIPLSIKEINFSLDISTHIQYRVIILSHNYWLPLPVDSFIALMQPTQLTHIHICGRQILPCFIVALLLGYWHKKIT